MRNEILKLYSKTCVSYIIIKEKKMYYSFVFMKQSYIKISMLKRKVKFNYFFFFLTESSS